MIRLPHYNKLLQVGPIIIPVHASDERTMTRKCFGRATRPPPPQPPLRDASSPRIRGSLQVVPSETSRRKQTCELVHNARGVETACIQQNTTTLFLCGFICLTPSVALCLYVSMSLSFCVSVSLCHCVSSLLLVTHHSLERHGCRAHRDPPVVAFSLQVFQPISKQAPEPHSPPLRSRD